MDEVLNLLQQPLFGSVTWAELIGDVTGVACVWLVARQHILNWPVGLANNAFFFLLFWWSKLYGDAVLQIVFAILAVYGWWQWATGDPERRREDLPVRRTTRREWVGLAAATLAGSLAGAYWLAHMTDSPVPTWDATVFAMSLAATYGQAKKLLESWWIWIAVDMLSVPLYVVRRLYPTAALYVAFFCLCIVGLRAWRRDLAATTTTAGVTVTEGEAA